MKHHESPSMRQSIEVAPKLELKSLPPNLRYVFLERDETMHGIIASDLNVQQVECLVEAFKRFK